MTVDDAPDVRLHQTITENAPHSRLHGGEPGDVARARFSRSGGGALGAAIASRGSASAWPTYVARQPVYDRDRNVVAYELLFRETATSEDAVVTDAQAATSEAALTAVADIGLDGLVGARRALMNVSRSFLLGEQVLALPPERVSLEVLESVEAAPDVLARLRELAARGYQIVLDDFVLSERTRPLLEIASLVKIDVNEADDEAIAAVVRELAAYPVRVVAEKLESEAGFERCHALGFHYFQGYLFGVPETMAGRRIGAAQPTVLNLLNALSRPDVTIEELEALIIQDVGLSVTLLRYMNSAAIGLGRRISSIREAIVYLGTETIRSFTYLVSLTAASQAPPELARIGMIRARMMELLAGSLGPADAPTSFTVGLLSVADALLTVPMAVLLEELDELDVRVKRALTGREGDLGVQLRWVESYERGRPDEIDAAGVSPMLMRDAYLRAVAWADETSSCLIAADRGTARVDPLRRAS
ncbi:MAG TPA: HDOD domain-containing protein [Gaiellales bacterium]